MSARRTIAITVILIAAGLGARKAIRGNDFAVYFAAAERVVHGQPLYEDWTVKKRHYLYPPSLAITLVPFSSLPFEVVATLWSTLAAGAIAGSALLLHRLSALGRGADPPAASFRVRWLGVAALVTVARPITSELGNGQANWIVLLCLAGATSLWARARPARAGFLIGLAAAIKVSAVFLCVYFLWRRAGRALAGTALALALFAVGLPLAVLGPGAFVETHRKWFDNIMLGSLGDEPAEASAATPVANGYSIRAAVDRVVTKTRASNRRGAEELYLNVVDWSRPSASLLYAFLATGVVAISLFATRRRARDDAHARWADLSIWISALIMVSPISRKAHFVILMIAFASSVAASTQSRRALVLPIIAVLLLNGTSRGLLSREVAIYAEAGGVLLLAVTILWSDCIRARGAMDRPERGVGTTAG